MLHSHKLILVGGIVLVISVITGFAVFEQLLNFGVRDGKQTALRKRNEIRRIYLKMPIPLDFRIYFFNVSNPMDVQEGKIPILKEVGPYCYEYGLTTPYRSNNKYLVDEAEQVGFQWALFTYFNQAASILHHLYLVLRISAPHCPGKWSYASSSISHLVQGSIDPDRASSTCLPFTGTPVCSGTGNLFLPGQLLQSISATFEQVQISFIGHKWPARLPCCLNK
ncbi:hypothetical protein NQ317_014680 [Molorchus minor]|uniref:Uncharacterized protein n=1 Tax=Molorchus minor TaxID=1323400 RepID=A0ABQ9J2K1_9CUCU|nr:hypothetical protein NQ317_014680 [Molorchus minor]